MDEGLGGPPPSPSPHYEVNGTMARKSARTVLQRQLDTRAKLWPDLDDRALWTKDSDGWVAVPRVMPIMMSIMDDMSGKGFPVSRTYFELWSRLRDENFLTLNRPEEMAFHAGFEGQRALRTWKDRVQRLADLSFIGTKPGPLGPLSYAVFYSPFHVIKRAYVLGGNNVQENKWQSLVVRANEVGAYDLDDIDDEGKLISLEDNDDDAITPSDDEKTVLKINLSNIKSPKRSRREPRAKKS